MRLFVLFALLLSAISIAFAAPIQSFEELDHILLNGDKVRVLVNLKACQVVDKECHNCKTPGPDVVGGFDLDVFNRHAIQVGKEQKLTISTSLNQIVNEPHYGLMEKYIRLRIFPDGTADLISIYYNPSNGQQLQHTIKRKRSYLCAYTGEERGLVLIAKPG